jgi:hypothetical protein
MRAAAQGETRTWADGRTRKKVGKRWVLVPEKKGQKKAVEKTTAKFWRRGSMFYDYAMASKHGGTIDDALSDMGIPNFKSLVNKIKRGPGDTAHKIYKKLVDTIHASEGSREDKQAAMHLIGQSILTVRNQFSTRPKVATMIPVRSKQTGAKYYKYGQKKDLPTLKSTAVSRAKKKMGGWSVTGKLESSHVKKMLQKKSAKLVFGKINAKKKWIMPKKAADIDLKYKGNSLRILVKQVNKTPKGTWATAKVELRIPYEFAKAYLQNHLTSVRTRNNFIFRMEQSEGYRNFLQRASA